MDARIERRHATGDDWSAVAELPINKLLVRSKRQRLSQTKMKSLHIIILVAAALLASSCRTHSPSLGVSLPGDAECIPESVIMTGPSTLVQEYRIIRNNVVFSVSVDEDNTINYMATQNRSFTTPDGISIGIPLDQVLALSGTKVERISGWAFVVALPSGWNAAFVQGDHMTEGRLDETAEVKFLFKSKQGSIHKKG